jgi:hypothetical protein
MFSFSVTTASRSFDARHGATAEISHGEEYSIGVSITDRSVTEGDATIYVDDKSIGTFRVLFGCRLLVDRPASVSRKLTFYKLGTAEAEQAGLVASPNLGVVKVVFVPGKPKCGVTYRSAVNCYGSAPTRGIGDQLRSSAKAVGGTGLGADSNQTFGIAQGIQLDYSRQQTLSIQLVLREEVVPLHPVEPVAPTPVVAQPGPVTVLVQRIDAAAMREPPPSALKASGFKSSSRRIRSSRDTLVYVDDRWGFATIERKDVQKPVDFNRLTNVSTKRNRSSESDREEFIGPVLTGRRIQGIESSAMMLYPITYKEATFPNEPDQRLWYTPITKCWCAGICDGTCNEHHVVHVAEILHPNVVCDMTGMYPIVGPRYIHSSRAIDVCENAYEKLPIFLQKQFLVLEYPDNAVSVDRSHDSR